MDKFLFLWIFLSFVLGCCLVWKEFAPFLSGFNTGLGRSRRAFSLGSVFPYDWGKTFQALYLLLHELLGFPVWLVITGNISGTLWAPYTISPNHLSSYCMSFGCFHPRVCQSLRNWTLAGALWRCLGIPWEAIFYLKPILQILATLARLEFCLCFFKQGRLWNPLGFLLPEPWATA